jgi:hypothetical protein
MKLYEIKGPGDYWAGDEFNPRSPDYDPRAIPKGARRNHPPADVDNDTLSDRDRQEDRMMRDVGKGIERAKAATRYTKQVGTTEQGERYNLVVTFTDPGGSSVNDPIANRWTDRERNIYNKVVGRKQGDDGSITLYVQAAPQSLLWNAVG